MRRRRRARDPDRAADRLCAGAAPGRHRVRRRHTATGRRRQGDGRSERRDVPHSSFRSEFRGPGERAVAGDELVYRRHTDPRNATALEHRFRYERPQAKQYTSPPTAAAMPQRSRTDFGDERPQTRWLTSPPAAATMPQRSRTDFGDERPQTRWLTSPPAAPAMPQRSRTDFGDERPQTRWLTSPPAAEAMPQRSRSDVGPERAQARWLTSPPAAPLMLRRSRTDIGQERAWERWDTSRARDRADHASRGMRRA